MYIMYHIKRPFIRSNHFDEDLKSEFVYASKWIEVDFLVSLLYVV